MEQSNGRRRPYRNRMEIAAGILQIARNGSRKTRIMYLGNLSFDLLQKYLEMLVNLGLLQARNEKEKIYVPQRSAASFWKILVNCKSIPKLLRQRDGRLRKV